MRQVEQLSTFSAPAQAPAQVCKSFITTDSVGRVQIEKYPSREAETMRQCHRLGHHLSLYLDQLMKVREGRVSTSVCVTVQFTLCTPQSTVGSTKKPSILYKQKKKYACPLHLSPLS
jgi:hypothetical protein